MHSFTPHAFRFLLIPVFLFSLLIMPSHNASAQTEIKVKGDMDFTVGAIGNHNLGGERQNDNTYTRQRLRLWIQAQTSENLYAFAMFRIAPALWGQSTYANGNQAGFGLDADGVNLRTRHLFVAYHPEGTNLTASVGIIPIEVPYESFYSGILLSCAGGINLSYKFSEDVAARFFWGRLYDDYSNDSEASGYKQGQSLHDEMDLLGLHVPVNMPSIRTKITPWAMYSKIGKDSGYWNARVPTIRYDGTKTLNDDATAWWAGFAARTDILDPVTLKLDFAWGTLDSSTKDGNFNTRGWQATFAADYQLDWAKPGIFGWYATGSDKDDVKNNQWGYTPVISTFGDSFNPTSFGFGGNAGLQAGNAVAYQPGGTWGVGVQLDDISFVKDLKHTVRVAYYKGTNDKELAANYQRHRSSRSDNIILTKSDSVWEVNFNHKYNIYDNLVLTGEFGYLHLDRCDDWKNDFDNNAWQAVASLKYKF